MSKRFLLLATSILSLILPSGKTHAQTDADLFRLPDTVCADHEITPLNIIEGAQNYNWTFCPPQYGNTPSGENIGAVGSVQSTKGVLIAQDEHINYTFHINADGSLIRMRYADGLNGLPSMITGIGTNINNPGGIHMVYDGRWHLFVIAGTDTGDARLIRYDFNENGLKSMPVEVNLGNLGGSLNGPRHLYIAKDGANWTGFTFSRNDELIRLDFGTDITRSPNVAHIGNIDDQFLGVSAITGIIRQDHWYLFVTSRTGNSLHRLSFGTSLGNWPEVTNLSHLDNRLSAPVGIAITRDCNDYYAFVLNNGTESITTLRWTGTQTLDSVPSTTMQGNVAGFELPHTMSNLMQDSSSVFLIAHNNDNTVSKIIIKSCTDAQPAAANEREPTFLFEEPGIYTVFLTINEGLPNVQTDCKQMIISPHSPITISNDTLICQNDTIRLTILSYGVDTFIWSPDFRINTLYGQFVDVYPNISTTYYVTAYYEHNCIVKKTIQVDVSKIVADAGQDRVITDGSTTILGGPETTLGAQYSYKWSPDIGLDYPRDSAVTRVRPPYDLTYYLEVTNTDGCYDIDTVIVSVPCDQVNMPNAFAPEGTLNKKFGLMNLQFIKINYFRIYDRWGKEVFATTDPQGKWDGTIDGIPAPIGVYVWEVDANCANTQQRFRKSGSVTLIR